MKFLDPTQATDTAQQPVKNGTLQFLQDSHKENLANLIQGLIGPGYSVNTPYALWGCNNFLAGYSPDFLLYAGAVFYKGEIFSFPVATVIPGAGQTAVLIISTAQYTPASPLQADPVVFTDGTSHNVHNVRSMQALLGPIGGAGVANYIADYSALQFPALVLSSEIAARTAADATLQSQINATPISTPLQSQINSLQTEIGTVPGGTTVEGQINTINGQINAFGANWQSGAPMLNGASISGTPLIGWVIIGNTMHLSWSFDASTSGSPNSFQVVLPSGATVGPHFNGDAVTWVNQGSNAVRAYASPGNTFFTIATMDGTNLPGATSVYRGSLTLEVTV